MKRAKFVATLLAGAGLAGLLWAAPVLAETNMDDALDRIERVLNDVEQMQRIMQDRPSEREHARERLARMQAELEQERVHAMSWAARVPERRVEAMRAHGMSWGQIAQELRVDPFVVGVATGSYGERDYRRGHHHDDDARFEQWHGRGHGQGYGRDHGMPPGLERRMHREDRDGF